ncbi:peptidylprolyl isomerase [Bacteroides sp.]
MRKNLVLLLTCLLGLSAFAQEDPVLMRINGKDITRSEFEYIYNKNNSLNELEAKTLDEYVDLFVNFKLKVAAAEAAGIDTTRAFRDELAGYRRQLAKSYLTDEEAEEAYAHQFYDKMKAESRAGHVQVMHIFKYLPQNVSKTHLNETEARMDSIYRVLSANPDADFATYVEKFSDDKNPFWVGFLQTPEEFEDVVFSMKSGEISKPFFSPQGMHIVKVLDRKELAPFAEVKDEISRRLTRKFGVDKGTEALVEKLKKEYDYQPNDEAVKELQAKGETDKDIFTLAGNAYTGADFKRFAASYPRSLKMQMDAFVIKSVLDYENGRLEEKYPAFRLLMQEYKEGMLLFEISNREVWERAVADEAGQTAYFDSHKSDYNYKEPRYKGIVVHCADKKMAKQIKKLIKKLPEKVWADTIAKTFNDSVEVVVKVEEGLFAKGDNKYVDKLVFKTGSFEPLESYPFTTVFGEKRKGPDSYLEVRGPLAADYQNFLESLWVKRLRDESKVEINQEVLKTVNNH